MAVCEKKALKVLVFMTQFGEPSGSERLAVELAEELNRRGIHADILSMYTEDFRGMRKAREELLKKGIPTVFFLGMKPHPSAGSMFSAILKLRRLIRKRDYDVVETSMISPTVLAAWATRGLRARHVAGLHDVFKKDRHGGMRNRVWRFSVRRSKLIRFYAISDYVKEQWIDYSHTPPQNTRRIYNGIPNDFFAAISDRESVRRELGIPLEGRLALFVGRCVKRKGIDTILEALEPILKSRNLHILYVGEEHVSENIFADEDGLFGRLKARARDNGLLDYVHFLGRRQDVARLMASADILVHPARIEGFGLVLAEALAVGLPVVASNVDGIPEVLDGSDSSMISPDDPETLRLAVLATLNRSCPDASRAIEKGRKRAESFRIDRRIDEMIVLFEDVLAGRM